MNVYEHDTFLGVNLVNFYFTTVDRKLSLKTSTRYELNIQVYKIN